MTTPGQQLTPGDDQNPPEYGVPEGAYVGDAGAPNAITDLNNLNEAEAKARMRAPINPSFIAQRDGVWGFFDSLLAIIQGGVNLVVGAVQAVVDGIAGVFGAIGSLFGLSSRDMAAIDHARVEAENKIVQNLGDSLEMLDEIQRAGGAYMSYPAFYITGGESNPYVLPVNEGMPLQEGTQFWSPAVPLIHSAEQVYGDNDTTREAMARGTGFLELTEPGFWRIDFQVAMLQGPLGYADPAEVWCYVTPAGTEWMPIGAPGLNAAGNSINGVMTRSRFSGAYSVQPIDGFLRAYGRGSAYVDQIDSNFGGGNTVSGSLFVMLPTGGWKVTMASMSHKRFSGASSTFMYATQVNTESLRDDIDAMKQTIEEAFPGEEVAKTLDQASIDSMVAQAQEIEVPEVELPDE